MVCQQFIKVAAIMIIITVKNVCQLKSRQNMNEEKINIQVECPVCGTLFITSSDSDKTQCPNCDFEFELEANP